MRASLLAAEWGKIRRAETIAAYGSVRYGVKDGAGGFYNPAVEFRIMNSDINAVFRPIGLPAKTFSLALLSTFRSD
jgi:hypothetical protein